ncbi:MAG TPA: hypothetical protein VF153_07845 [Candidatus Limnocylindria bacterium]
MRGWLGRGGAAVGIAADRADLWPAGTLAWLAFVGWLPLLLTVAPPDAEGIEAFGVSFYLSQWFPLNLVLLAAVAVMLFMLLCLVSAGAEVAIERSADPTAERPPAGRAIGAAFTVMLLAAVPVVAASALVAMGVVTVAPAEYLSADLATPVLLRIALRLLPQLAIVLVVLLAMQALAGTALRISFARRGSAATAFGGALRTLHHQPLAVTGVAVVGLLLDAVNVALNLVLLRLLWAPIAVGLGDGLGRGPQTILLLVGFVAVWLGLLLTAGALHVAVSAWWAMEVGIGARTSGAAERHGPARRPAGTVAGTESGGPH